RQRGRRRLERRNVSGYNRPAFVHQLQPVSTLEDLMNRAHVVVAATLLCGGLATVANAQNPAPPPMSPVLAGKKFTAPFKGQAEVDFTKPVTKRDKDMVVTTLQVKNNTNAPLLRLTVDETWYDKAGGLVTGGKGVVNRLEPGEIGTVKIETPFNAKM